MMKNLDTTDENKAEHEVETAPKVQRNERTQEIRREEPVANPSQQTLILQERVGPEATQQPKQLELTVLQEAGESLAKRVEGVGWFKKLMLLLIGMQAATFALNRTNGFVSKSLFGPSAAEQERIKLKQEADATGRRLTDAVYGAAGVSILYAANNYRRKQLADKLFAVVDAKEGVKPEQIAALAQIYKAGALSDEEAVIAARKRLGIS
jgi:hypothetical protein